MEEFLSGTVVDDTDVSIGLTLGDGKRFAHHFTQRNRISQSKLSQVFPCLAIGTGCHLHLLQVVAVVDFTALHVHHDVTFGQRFIQCYLDVMRIAYLPVPVTVPEGGLESVNQVLNV